MATEHEPSARLRAAFLGCYEGPRAAALSGVPKSTVYLWARKGLVKPSVSPSRIKLWSYADLMALRIVHWLRHSKEGYGMTIPASPMRDVRRALHNLEQRGIDIWDEDRVESPLRVDPSGQILIVSDEGTENARGQFLNLYLDPLGPFPSGDSKGAGPSLLRPRPCLRIIPGRVSGEPHLVGSRITTQVVAALYREIKDVGKIAGLYPGVSIPTIEQAIDLEHFLAA